MRAKDRRWGPKRSQIRRLHKQVKPGREDEYDTDRRIDTRATQADTGSEQEEIYPEGPYAVGGPRAGGTASEGHEDVSEIPLRGNGMAGTGAGSGAVGRPDTMVCRGGMLTFEDIKSTS